MKRTSINTIIGFLLKEMRLRSGLSQEYIAQQLSMTKAGWGKVENGNATISISKLYHVSDLFNVDPLEIMDDAERIKDLLVEQGWIIEAERIDNDGLIQAKNKHSTSEISFSVHQTQGYFSPADSLAMYFAKTL